MSLFKATDEELDVEDSMKEFILEDLDKFVDPDSSKGPILQVMNGSCTTVFMHTARDSLISDSQEQHEPQRGSRRMSSGGKRRADL